MTRILVLSDTHMPRPRRSLPPQVLAEMKRVDLILHLGDVTEESVLDDLGDSAPVRAVHGNNDSFELQIHLPAVDRFALQGHRFVLIHGHVGARTAREAALKIVDADVVLFGHSHRAWQSYVDGTLYLNPGSPTDARWSPSRAFATLDVDDVVEATIVAVETP